MSRKVVITGATGLIGRKLCAKLAARGDELTIFTRSAATARKEVPASSRIVEWDYRKPKQWSSFLEGQDAVIHLAGVNLFKQRWTDEFKSRILESREVSTTNLSQSINNLKQKPEVFISASAIGIYGDSGSQEVTESTPPGEDFLAQVCKVWEKSAALVESSGVRRVSIRTGVVLSTKEGALKEMLLPFKLFVGGPLGTGKQWFSWVHLSDVVDGYLFALDNKILTGPANLSSPNPVKMKQFATTLGKVLNRPSFFRVPEFVLMLAAGEASEVVAYSQKIIPYKLLKCGFRFRYSDLEEALTDIIKEKG